MAKYSGHSKKGSGGRSAFLAFCIIGKAFKLRAKDKAPEKTAHLDEVINH